jgi:hypothetical protein
MGIIDRNDNKRSLSQISSSSVGRETYIVDFNTWRIFSSAPISLIKHHTVADDLLKQNTANLGSDIIIASENSSKAGQDNTLYNDDSSNLVNDGVIGIDSGNNNIADEITGCYLEID